MTGGFFIGKQSPSPWKEHSCRSLRVRSFDFAGRGTAIQDTRGPSDEDWNDDHLRSADCEMGHSSSEKQTGVGIQRNSPLCGESCLLPLLAGISVRDVRFDFVQGFRPCNGVSGFESVVRSRQIESQCRF